jgi:glycerophosphoryl diester phosphodiesterase
LDFFERMLADGLDIVPLFHAAGALVDVWTLDAGTPEWETRLARAVAAGVDLVTTNTPHALSATGVTDSAEAAR